MSVLATCLSCLTEQSQFVGSIDLGTTARPTTYWVAALSKHFGTDLEAGGHIRAIQFDAQQDAAAAQVPALGGASNTVHAPWNTFIPGQVPDADSLLRLEGAGRLYFTRPDWATQEGQAKEGAGTGGNPRRARALFECLKPQIEKAVTDLCRASLDYERQCQKILASDREPDGGVLPVVLTYATPGGFGPGVVHAITRLIARVAARLGVHVKLFIVGLGLGTIAPSNPDQGALNEEALLRYIQAGMVADLNYASEGTPIVQPLSESYIWLTNQNRFGEIPSLAGLQAVGGYFKFLLASTGIGRLLMERIVDVEDPDRTDDHGGPCCASTFGLSLLHLDAERLLAYAGYDAARALCEGLLARPDKGPIRQAVIQAAREFDLVESAEETLASTRLARLEAFEGEDLHDRLRNVFATRLEGLYGFDLCEEAPRVYRFCVSHELAENLMPSVRKTARELFAEAIKAVKEEVAGLLKRPAGAGKAQQYLNDFRLLVQRSAQANAETSRAVGESLRPVQETLSDTEDQIETLAQRNAFVRAFMPFTKTRLGQTYRLAAEAALRSHAEIGLRRVLAQDLFRPLLAALDRELARINRVLTRIEAVKERAEAGLQETVDLPVDRLVPVGLELVNREFLERRTVGFIEACGDREKLADRLFETYIDRHGSFPGLAEDDADAVTRNIVPLCQAPFEDPVRAMDVLKVFRQEYPDPGKQRQILEQLVREASGRLLVTGEAGEPVTWIKIVGLGDPAANDSFLAALRDADPASGEWLPAAHGDPYTVVLLMYRSGISVDGILRQTRRRRTTPNRRLTPASGPDPITFVLPSVRPDEAELSRTIVRGLVTDAVDFVDALCSTIEPGGEIRLGRTPEEARRALAQDFAARVRLTVGFVRELAHRHDEVIDLLAGLRRRLAEDSNFRVDGLVDVRAVRAVEQEAEALWPYLKRLPPNRR